MVVNGHTAALVVCVCDVVAAAHMHGNYAMNSCFRVWHRTVSLRQMLMRFILTLRLGVNGAIRGLALDASWTFRLRLSLGLGMRCHRAGVLQVWREMLHWDCSLTLASSALPDDS